MDGYLSKPVKRRQLEVAIRSIVAGRYISEASDPSLPYADILDENELLDQMGGSKALLREAVRLYMEDYPKRVSRLREAVTLGDARVIGSVAHRLKGITGTLGGHRAMNAANRLEDIGRSGDLTDAPETLKQLEVELERLGWSLKRFVGDDDQ